VTNEGVFPKVDGDISYASDFNRIDIRSSYGSWTSSYVTGGTSYADVTDATITLSGLDSSKTYNVYVLFSTTAYINSTNNGYVKLLIGSTNVNEKNIVHSASGEQDSLVMAGATQISASTSVTAKLQAKHAGGGALTINDAGGTYTSSIIIIALPQ